MIDKYNVQVIASVEELKQIGIPEDDVIHMQFFKAWDLGIATYDRFGEIAKVGEEADDDWWFYHIPVKWLRFLDNQEVMLNNLIKQSNETSKN